MGIPTAMPIVVVEESPAVSPELDVPVSVGFVAPLVLAAGTVEVSEIVVDFSDAVVEVMRVVYI